MTRDSVSNHLLRLRHFSSLILLVGFVCKTSLAQEAPEEIYILGEADYLSILPDEDSSSAFGLDKSLSETPRSVTEVSADLIDKFSLRSVDDLVRLTPGAFTSSFFGIKGAMDIRGEPADNFFRGFRRVANPGAFNTIVRGAEKLEILRGPVSPLYGNGSVGGQLNYIPKSSNSRDAKYDDVVTGDASITVGSYNQRVASANLSVPLSTDTVDGGMHIFIDVEDSESFYDLYEPSSELAQIAFDFNFSDSLRIEFGGQYQTTDSIQVPGWNRVTQALIDNGTYITGTPSDRNTGGDPTQLLPQETGFITSAAFTGINNSFSNVGTFCIPTDSGTATLFYNEHPINCLGAPAEWFPLQDGTVGTTQLDHSTTFIDELDYADTTAVTFYTDVTKTFENESELEIAFFYDYLDHTKFQSWGFTADYPGVNLFELRTSYKFKFESGGLTATSIVGASYREEDIELKHAFYDETFDFRDISVGATPNDRIAAAVDNPFEGVVFTTDGVTNTGVESGTLLRNFNLHEVSTNENVGIFSLTDFAFADFNFLLGLRYDIFDVTSEDIAVSLLQNRFDSVTDWAGEQNADKDAFTFNTSLSYNFDFGLKPYITYAESTSLATNQVGGISPATVKSNAFLQESELFEVGLKFEGLDGRLFGALSYYDQEKVARTGQTAALTQVFASGVEMELRAVITDEFSLIATATNSETTEIGDAIFTVVNLADFAEENNLQPEDLYDGRVAGDRATFVGEGAELDRGGLPDTIFSLYGTYLLEMGAQDFTFSLGFTNVSSTYTDVFESVELPSYTVWTGSIRYERDQFSALVQLNNMTDEEYYTSADLFDSVVVKPSEGATASLTLTYNFGY